MTIDELYPHNREAYEKVKESFLTHDRAAIVHATGTGKSYVIAAVAADYGRVLILAPNDYVLEEVGKRGVGAELRTYPWLLGRDFFPAGSYDLIVLDEFHRAGAKEWGSKVRDLLDANPDAKVFGTTATEVRYLDAGRNMADELFDGNVVSRLDLPDAWARGILPVPLYVIGLCDFETVYSDLVRKLEHNRRLSSGELAGARDALRRGTLGWEESHGIPAILRRHLPADTRRMIVFCSRIEEVGRIEERFVQWMATAGFRCAVYTVHSHFDGSVEDMSEFRRNEDGAVKVLFAIDMLNEGIHVPDVDAVVMLRCTGSRIIQLQQMGRCMNAGSVRRPVILDLVDNLTKTAELDTLREQYDSRLAPGLAVNASPATVTGFTVFDYVKDFREVVAGLRALRPLTAQEWLDDLKAWVEAAGRWPKANSEDHAEARLAQFASRCRNVPEVAAFREEAAERYGLTFPARRETLSFEQHAALLDEFIAREGRWPEHSTRDEEEDDLREFVTRTKRQSPERFEEIRANVLEKYGVDCIIRSSKRVDVEKRARELEAFVREQGRWPGYVGTEEEKFLAQFAVSFRDTPAVSSIREMAEKEFGVTFRLKRNDFGRMTENIRAFVRENGRWPSHGTPDQRERNMNAFLRTHKEDPRLTELRRELAPAAGGDISFKESKRIDIAVMTARLRDFINANKRWPRGGASPEEEKKLQQFAKMHASLPEVQELRTLAREEYGDTTGFTYDTETWLPRLRAFAKERMRFPKQGSADSEERQLQAFKSKLRKTCPAVHDAFVAEMRSMEGFECRNIVDREDLFARLEKYIHTIGRWPSLAAGDDPAMVRAAQNYGNDPKVVHLREVCEKEYGARFRKTESERAEDYRAFVLNRRRCPSYASEDAGEKSLAAWARQNGGNAVVADCRALASEYEREDADREFGKRLEGLESFVKKRRRWPSHHVTDPEEKEWGIFVNRHRADARIVAAKRRITSSLGVQTTQKGEDRVKELEAFVAANGRAPDRRTPAELSLYNFLASNKRKGPFSEQILKILSTLPEEKVPVRPVKVIESAELSRDEPDGLTGGYTHVPRYVCVDAETGDVLDDAHGFGFKSEETALAAYANRSRKK